MAKKLKNMFDNKNWIKWLAELLAVIIGLLVWFLGSQPPNTDYDVRMAVFGIDDAIIWPIIGSIAAAGIGAGSAALSNKQNQRNWEKQNEYNTPSSQMERYRAAGLNPNLIYGSGQSSAGNAGSIAQYQTTKFDSNDILNMVNAITNIRLQESQIKKSEAEANSVNLENQMKAYEASTYSLMRDYQVESARLNNLYRLGLIDMQQYQKGMVVAQTNSIIANTNLSRQQLKLAKQAYNVNAWSFGKSKELWNYQKTALQDENWMRQYDREHYAAFAKQKYSKGLVGMFGGGLGAAVGAALPFIKALNPAPVYHNFYNY